MMKGPRSAKCVPVSFAALFSVLFLTAASPDAGPLMTWESPVFTGEGTEYYPDDVMSAEGQEYELVSFKLIPVEQEGDRIYADASIEFQLEGREVPPESAVITLMDDATGNEYEREVPLIEMVEKDIFWSDDFSFEITVTDYDADLYYLEDTYIMAGEDLKDYGEELIESLGLPPELYRVDDVKWRGAPYEYEGTIMRDAVATGGKLVRTVEVTYGGDVLTPAVKGKQYIAEYSLILPEESQEQTEEETETEGEPQTVAKYPETGEEEILPGEVPGMIERIFRWVREHLSAVTLGAGSVIILLAAMFLLFRSGRRSKPGRP